MKAQYLKVVLELLYGLLGHHDSEMILTYFEKLREY